MPRRVHAGTAGHRSGGHPPALAGAGTEQTLSAEGQREKTVLAGGGGLAELARQRLADFRSRWRWPPNISFWGWPRPITRSRSGSGSRGSIPTCSRERYDSCMDVRRRGPWILIENRSKWKTTTPRRRPGTIAGPRNAGPEQRDGPRRTRIATLRVLDTAANRAREGLRVVEDYVRFVLDDRHLTGLCKQLRHDLSRRLAADPGRTSAWPPGRRRPTWARGSPRRPSRAAPTPPKCWRPISPACKSRSAAWRSSASCRRQPGGRLQATALSHLHVAAGGRNHPRQHRRLAAQALRVDRWPAVDRRVRTAGPAD